MIILESFRNIFAVPDLRKRVLFTFGLLAIYRIGSHIPTPGLDAQALEEFFKASAGGLLGFLDMFSGGALRRLSVFALGITPYITASIILQLLTVVWPYLEKLSKEGEMGRRKITQYTRYGTVVLSVVQGAGIALWLWAATTPTGKYLVLRDPTSEGGKIAFVLMAILTLTTGTAFVMWLGEQITERGIGNGISLIIFAGIVVGLPTAVWQSFRQIQRGQMSLFTALLLTVFMLVVVAAIVFVERAQRRIPVQYAKRVVGRRVYGGQNTYLPAPGEHGRRHPDHLRRLDHPVPAVPRLGVQERLHEEAGRPARHGASRSTTSSTPSRSSSSATSTSRSSSTRRTPPRTCGSTAGSSRASARARRPSDYIDSVLTRITLIGAALPRRSSP